ncbi:telomere length regulation protein TEL2 homolog isoform X1 [Clytia hemisphaerica]|uniref:Telomere length regulation protein TEL2 homolog n=1 Tax=Clytia hemisphaerica TaxID=252671 RepID=A0A7M5XAH9_9CNID
MVEKREKNFSCVYLKLMQLFQNTENFEEVRQLIVTWNGSAISDSTINVRGCKFETKEVTEVLKDPVYLKNISDKLFTQIEYNPEHFPGAEEFERFISSGDKSQSFIVQTNLFDGKQKIDSKSCHSSVEKLLCESLVNFLKKDRLVDVFWQQCMVKPTQVLNQRHVYAPSVQTTWDHLERLIVTLPDLISNRLKLATSSCFVPKNYTQIISRAFLETLRRIQNALQNSQDCSLHFLSQLVGKFCMRGYADLLFDELLPEFVDLSKKSPLWRRICSKLVTSVHENQLEAVLQPIIKRYESLDVFSYLLDSINLTSNNKLKFLFTNKWIFIKTAPNDIVPYLVLKHLTKYENEFKKVLFKLLKVWGDQGAIQNTSIKQHEYLSKCILISLGLLTGELKKAWKQELIMKLLETVQCHLQSPNVKIRDFGMVIAEMLTKTVDGEDGKILNFELQRTDEIEYLYSLANDPLNALRVRYVPQSKEEETNNIKQQAEVTESLPNKRASFQSKGREESLDSDDEFEPLNVENGKEIDENIQSVNGVQPPLYLRDCISGLLSNKDPDRLETCLKALANLVRKEPGDLNDVANELLRILLHLENEYNITDFHQIKSESICLVTCKCPNQTSVYLCQQFFEENYSITQRLDILEAISSSVTILAKPESENPEEYRAHLPAPNVKFTKGVEPPEWKAIVDERIKKKTKRFNSGKRQEIEAKENRLSTVIGSFFYPLIQHFGTLNQSSKLLSTEPMLLGKYIYTLALILQAAYGLPEVTAMSRTLLEMIWGVRFHSESFVRQALIFATSKVVFNVPSFALMSEIQSEIMEAQSWLHGIVERDPDMECRKLAASTLMLLEKTLQKELLGHG